MSDHALLSPSSAHRWLNCPRSPRLEAQLPEKPSKDADIGTLAHSVCEISAKKRFKKVKAAEYNKVMKKLKAAELWDDEMLRTADVYVDHLAERAMKFEHEPYIAFEVQVDVSDYVPEAFGRCDCVMFGDGVLVITDYKNGKGVMVSAEANPQLMLYALGALKLYKPIFGETIQKIEVCIDQPRLEMYSVWTCGIKELLDWGESIKPKASMAFMGFGEYHSGDWCRFCRANGSCKEQAKLHTSALDDFAPAIGQPAGILSPEEIGEILKRGKSFVEWFEKVKQQALEIALSGVPIPGYKVIEGTSNRAWSNQDEAIETLIKAGIEREAIYDNVPKSLAQLEKMLGKANFSELVGEFVVKPQGSPKLAPADDKHPEYKSAVADFAAVANENNSDI